MRLVRAEMTKLIFQRRTYVGWAGLLVVPMLMTLALYLNRGRAHHDNGPGGFITLASHNGMIVPVAAIAVLTGFLLPLLASMSGSYQLAGEAESATIKTWLTHPVSRGGVLMSKWVVAVVYLVIGLLLVAVGGYAAGGIAFGLHAPLLLSGNTVSIAHGLGLTALAFLIVLAGTLCVIALAMLFSTFTSSSLTAAIAALVVVIVMNIVGAFSYFDFLKPYLFTSHLDAWQNLFRQPIVWQPIDKALLAFAVYIVGLTLAAWYVFRRKDVLV
jgi:ABC-2 type transport system permease protein